VYDPYFGEIVDKPGPASRVGKVLLAIYLTGVLALVGLNLVMAVLFTIRLISARERSPDRPVHAGRLIVAVHGPNRLYSSDVVLLA
jgi:hypothetical protein